MITLNLKLDTLEKWCKIIIFLNKKHNEEPNTTVNKKRKKHIYKIKK